LLCFMLVFYLTLPSRAMRVIKNRKRSALEAQAKAEELFDSTDDYRLKREALGVDPRIVKVHLFAVFSGSGKIYSHCGLNPATRLS